jgi:DNA-binding transcriptional ArsR family regulator
VKQGLVRFPDSELSTQRLESAGDPANLHRFAPEPQISLLEIRASRTRTAANVVQICSGSLAGMRWRVGGPHFHFGNFRHILLDQSRSAASEHLAVLREAGLVREERQGRHRVYHLQAAGLSEVGGWLKHYEHHWNRRLDALGNLLDELTEEENP